MNDQIIPKDFTTEKELDFLKSIRLNRKALEGYIKASEKRVRWGFINKDSVVSYAKVLLVGLA